MDDLVRVTHTQSLLIALFATFRDCKGFRDSAKEISKWVQSPLSYHRRGIMFGQKIVYTPDRSYIKGIVEQIKKRNKILNEQEEKKKSKLKKKT
tara:strand:- start:5112 stop:5393 length:282 start_codon:yes stop_codon:yes gene_type:complete